MNQAQEDLLVLAAQQGNVEALDFLCRHYHKGLFRYAYKIAGDKQLALDAQQEAWIKISAKLRTLEDPRAFKSWIFRAVRWSVYDMLRKSQRHDALFEAQNNTDEVAQATETDTTTPDGLLQMVDQLPDIDKQAIHLFYMEEMKISEIAAILQTPIGTVKSRLNRARKALKEQMKTIKE